MCETDTVSRHGGDDFLILLAKMARLVSELLDPLQVGKAQMLLGEQTFDAAEAIGVAVEACRPAVDRRQQTLETTISRPLEVNGDRAAPNRR